MTDDHYTTEEISVKFSELAEKSTRDLVTILTTASKILSSRGTNDVPSTIGQASDIFFEDREFTIADMYDMTDSELWLLSSTVEKLCDQRLEERLSSHL